jgi:eukaryotic-like serine/threonine-protein kinase
LDDFGGRFFAVPRYLAVPPTTFKYPPDGAASSHPNDETLAAPPSQVAHADSSQLRMRVSARQQVALVEGSTPHLSSETRDLLRSRLRTTAILFFVAFSAFLCRWAFHWEVWGQSEHRWLFYVQGAVTLSLGLSSIFLCRHCAYSLTKLRIMELLVFGGPALFFMLWQYHDTMSLARLTDGGAHIPVIAVPWMLLIFTYAMFIPNTWPRALAVLATLGAIPLALIATFTWQSAEYRAMVNGASYSGYYSGHVLMIVIAVMVATVGVHTIGTLRREAFTAKQLGQYRLKQRLGSGGMGEVYLAEHQMMKRPCAVKLIRPEKAGDPRMLARFEREVRATAKLSHWNSIEIYDYGHTADGTFYYVMEYLPGHNMNEMIEQYGTMPAGRVVYLMEQTCAALAEAHGIGLVHRDIKPANIFCAYRGGIFDVAKLLDFGLAKPLSENLDASLTQEGAITGSPLFMSPEQATGGDAVDGRSDIYSLGAVMYYMLTGQPPFAYENPFKAMIAHATETVIPPRQVNVDVPEGLEEIVMRCLEKDPEHRFQDVATMQRALHEVDLVDPWSSDLAAQWWSHNGCPERKKLAAAVVEAAAV